MALMKAIVLHLALRGALRRRLPAAPRSIDNDENMALADGTRAKPVSTLEGRAPRAASTAQRLR